MRYYIESPTDQELHEVPEAAFITFRDAVGAWTDTSSWDVKYYPRTGHNTEHFLVVGRKLFTPE